MLGQIIKGIAKFSKEHIIITMGACAVITGALAVIGSKVASDIEKECTNVVIENDEVKIVTNDSPITVHVVKVASASSAVMCVGFIGITLLHLLVADRAYTRDLNFYMEDPEKYNKIMEIIKEQNEILGGK